MQAFQVLTHESSPEVVEIIEPSPGRGEVVLEILACGLNFADLLMAKGTYQETPPVPFTLGLEVCGRAVHGKYDIEQWNEVVRKRAVEATSPRPQLLPRTDAGVAWFLRKHPR